MQVLYVAGFDENLVMDFENEYFIGHSSGSHVVVNYLIEKCGNFKGLVLMSPVDGVDPFGITNEFCITPGELVNFDIPTLILPTGLDAVSGKLSCPAHNYVRIW